MAQSITIIITPTSDTIGTLNSCILPTEGRETINCLINYLSAIAGGAKQCNIQVVTNNTAPTVTTDGGVSTSATFNLS